MSPHEALRSLRREDAAFAEHCRSYRQKFALPDLS